MTSRPHPPPATAAPDSHLRPRSHTLLLAAVAAFPSAILILLVLLLLFYVYFSHRRRSPTLPFDTPATLGRFSHRELHSATAGFGPSRSLGRGTSASVFRGILADGKSVAVMRLDPLPPASPSGHLQFLNELQVLAYLPHSPFVVSLLGYCLEDSRRRLLVYEYMSNGSLQEALFGPNRSLIHWSRRFHIILDLAQALVFLHLTCDPPVIHGDIKPSNVLLGPDFQAKISDFGLSRLRTEVAASGAVDLLSQELNPSQELFSGSPQVDFSVAIRSSSNSCLNHEKNVSPIGICGGGAASPTRKELAVTHCHDEVGCVESCKELVGNFLSDDTSVDARRHWGNDCWWKQDESCEVSSSDYVREWIGTQICPGKNPDWDDDMKTLPEFRNSNRMERFEKGCLGETLFGDSGLGSHVWSQEKKPKVRVEDGFNMRDRTMREWWKEEYFSEISKKGKVNKGMRWFRTNSSSYRVERSSGNGYNNYRGGGVLNVDISFRKGWKKKSQSLSNEMWSGHILSKEFSSTASLRGTVCYVAPEYRCCGHLMEKADIYSFGVLILVIVSGRRPLHVLQSPMKLDRANLISWCRQLAQTGNLLDILDEKLKDSYKKDQVSLCINLALLCLQRLPDTRPDSGDIVKILKGEMDLPEIPFEASPSPTSKLFSISKRKPYSRC